MYTTEIQFRVLNNINSELKKNCIDGMIVALQRSGQILSDEWPIAASRTLMRTFVSVPERNSLQRKNESKWVAGHRNTLTEAGLSQPSYKILGREPSTLNPCQCDKPTGFILYTDFLSVESPLRCSDCFGPVPLYKIQPTSYCNTFEDIICWRRNYQNCDALQMGCTVGERFGTRQLLLFDSELSKEGLECCRRITEVTKRPCSYYLYRYFGRSRAQEVQRSCPSCGKKWRLKETWHKLFDFRCDRCQLLSNFAYSLF